MNSKFAFPQKKTSLINSRSPKSFISITNTRKNIALFTTTRTYDRTSFAGSSRSHVFPSWAFGLFAGLTGVAVFMATVEGEEKKETKEAVNVDYAKVRKEISKVITDDPNRGPTLIRLAWHASGTYSMHDHTGGSNGATIRFPPESAHGANAGLSLARDWMEKVKKANPGISYADLYTLAGVVAIEEMSGPKIPWRPGRTDTVDGKTCPPNGRLPDAAKGEQHIREIFGRMGFNDREIVALIGAHAVGRCHTDRSGYDGPWTKSPLMFSNDYYRELLENTWTPRKWKGPEQFTDKSGELMMLPGDLAFIKDPAFKKYVEMYAKDEELWFKDFAKAFQKLEELGVKEFEKKRWAFW